MCLHAKLTYFVVSSIKLCKQAYVSKPFTTSSGSPTTYNWRTAFLSKADQDGDSSSQAQHTDSGDRRPHRRSDQADTTVSAAGVVNSVIVDSSWFVRDQNATASPSDEESRH